jgi:two-component system, chemotaxis family, CheB/CheR fusion protein
MSDRSEPSSPSSNPSEPVTTSDDRPEFFLVGIGASAGGLEAMIELLQALPQPLEVAVLVVQHMDPAHESHLVELLARATPTPVKWAEHMQPVEPGQVYVVPPGVCVTMRKRVVEFAEEKNRSGEINFLFRSLAEDAKEYAVGVLLSGNGTDGAQGCRAIKAAGGFVLAQELSTAKYPSMPRAAIESRCVDLTLPPAAIAKELARLTRSSAQLWEQIGGADDPQSAGSEAEQFAALFRLLASRTGVDFSDYKMPTIRRRLVRRMMLSNISDLHEYVKLLHRSRDEVERLYETLLINVTEFFRDPDSFDFLREHILPAIIKQHADNSAIRMWVPGCSTGEEVYSLAITVQELLDAGSSSIPVQIFGTDVSEPAITSARGAKYLAAEVANVSAERLRTFFSKADGHYVVQKKIRDMCVFARQNVVKDAPFSRLDLISCRNLLIYFNAKLQRKLMPIFHYALLPTGYLVLGSSESVGGQADLYRLVDRRFRIYSRKSSGRRTHFELDPYHSRLEQVSPLRHPRELMEREDAKDAFDIIREADRIVLGRQGPSGVLVNDELDIVQFRGDVLPYLSPGSGRATLNLLRMARDNLATELQALLQQAREQGTRVHKAGVALMHDREARMVDIDVTPIDAVPTKERFYLILFSEAVASAPAAKADGKTRSHKAQDQAQMEQLRQDLQATRSYLQSAIEKGEATNQELRAANEEIQSSNEELQSTNEELETAKEELQSTNEELMTVNEELHNRQLDLIQINNDLQNLVTSVHLPIVILGPRMQIRRFTPMAEKVLNMIPTDIGRPLTDINIGLDVKNIAGLVAEVMDTPATKEVDVQDAAGRWHSLRLRPYKTYENKIDGVVMTLIDIDQLKRTAAEAEEARKLAEAVIETTREPLAALTSDLKVQSANEAFYQLFNTSKERIENRSFFEAVNSPETLDPLRRALEGIIPTKQSLLNYEVGIDLPGTGPTALVINMRQIASSVRTYPLILLSVRKS